MLELYKNIKRRREELGLSQSELAQKTGYTSKTSISKIEAGKIDLPQSKIEAFAAALDTTPSALMGWDRLEEQIVEAVNSPGKWRTFTSQKMVDSTPKLEASPIILREEKRDNTESDFWAFVAGMFSGYASARDNVSIETLEAIEDKLPAESTSYHQVQILGDSLQIPRDKQEHLISTAKSHFEKSKEVTIKELTEMLSKLPEKDLTLILKYMEKKVEKPL